MNQFVRLAQAPAIAVVFASVLIGGCATAESGGRAKILSSNQYWLDAAVERSIKSSRESNGHREATVWFEHELQSGQMITSPNQCAPAPAAPLGADN